MRYDEDRELTDYIWGQYAWLMTEFELRVGHAILARSQAAQSNSMETAKEINRLWGAISDTEVNAALADGPEIFRKRVRNRVLAEHQAEVNVKRCPKCGRVVRMLKTHLHQCFWCGFDWQRANVEPFHSPDTSTEPDSAN